MLFSKAEVGNWKEVWVPAQCHQGWNYIATAKSGQFHLVFSSSEVVYCGGTVTELPFNLACHKKGEGMSVCMLRCSIILHLIWDVCRETTFFFFFTSICLLKMEALNTRERVKSLSKTIICVFVLPYVIPTKLLKLTGCVQCSMVFFMHLVDELEPFGNWNSQWLWPHLRYVQCS